MGLGTFTYDDAGNLTDWNGTIYTYDPLNRLTQLQAGSSSWTRTGGPPGGPASKD